MTKMKSKKTTKSTFAIIIMGIIMVAMLAFGGTFAYFTATATTKTGSVTTGTISLKTTGSTISIAKANVLPKESLLTTDEAAAITYDTKDANRDQVAFFIISVKATGKDGNDVTSSVTLTLTAPTLTGLTPVTLDGATATSKTLAVIIPSATNSVTMSGLQVAFDADAKNENGAGHNLMGATITLTIEAKSIQAVDDDGADISELTKESAAALLAKIA